MDGWTDGTMNRASGLCSMRYIVLVDGGCGLLPFFLRGLHDDDGDHPLALAVVENVLDVSSTCPIDACVPSNPE